MSSAHEHDPCAMCAKFVRKDKEQAARGYGWCLGYERYVHATGSPTVLFKPAMADQLGERGTFLEQHQDAA